MRAIVLMLLLLAGSAGDHAKRDPVLIELFTSQGCSSCPPADALLTELGRNPRVIPLAYHVDYWNYIGWRDPFSSAKWSDRQRRYATALSASRVYTPQLIVGGSREVVGNDRPGVRTAIERALQQPAPASIRLEVTQRKNQFEVGIQSGSASPGDVFLVIYQNNAVTPVRSGENIGKVLRNDYVVRNMVRAGSAVPGRSTSMFLTVPFPEEWNPSGIVAFVQDSRTMRILATTRWTSK